MAFLVKLPPLGEGIFEAQVVHLYKKVGDEIKEGDIIAEMETDKAVGALAAPTSGTIEELYVELGDFIFRNENILLIDDGQEGVSTGAGGDGGRVASDGTIVAPPADEKLAESPYQQPPAKPKKTKPVTSEKPEVKRPKPANKEVVKPKVEPPKPLSKKPKEKEEMKLEKNVEKHTSVVEDGVHIVDKLGSAKEMHDYFAGVEKAAEEDKPKPDVKFMLEQGQAQQGEPKPATTRKTRYIEPLHDNFEHSLDGSKPIPTHLNQDRTVEELMESGKDARTVPALRKYAAEHGIDLAFLPGDENRLITKEEIDEAIKHKVGEREWNYRLIDNNDPGYWTHRPEEEQGREETYIRKYNASRFEMTHNKVPPFSVQLSVDVTKLQTLAQLMTGEKSPTNRPLLPFIVKALGKACYRFPELNASIDDVAAIFRFKSYMNVGIEMNTVKGLFTPVLKDAHLMSIEEIHQGIQALGDEVKVQGIFNYETNSEGTISLSDLSEYGEVDGFIPIVHYPEAAILGLAKVTEKPIIEDGELVVRPLLPMTLVVDHRIVTRDKVVRIMHYLKDLLEEPSLLFKQGE